MQFENAFLHFYSSFYFKFDSFPQNIKFMINYWSWSKPALNFILTVYSLHILSIILAADTKVYFQGIAAETNKASQNYTQKNWFFWYFKLRLFELTEFIVWNFLGLWLWVPKI